MEKKILFLISEAALANRGGDLVHCQQLAASLRSIGHHVEIHSDPRTARPLNAWGVIHLFNLSHLLWLKNSVSVIKKDGFMGQLILTPIYIPFGYFASIFDERWVTREAFRFRAFAVLKGLVRDGSCNLLALRYAIRSQVRNLLSNFDRLIVNSWGEACAVSKAFEVVESRINAVPNGMAFIESGEDEDEDEDVIKNFDKYCLSIGRVDPLKNQLRLSEACKAINLPLVLVGPVSARGTGYLKRCLDVGEGNTIWLGELEATAVARLYTNARCHVLPSLFETFSLVTADSLANKCPAVVGDSGYLRSVYEDAVIYCDPFDVESIITAINNAVLLDRAPPHHNLCSWHEAATMVNELYFA